LGSDIIKTAFSPNIFGMDMANIMRNPIAIRRFSVNLVKANMDGLEEIGQGTISIYGFSAKNHPWLFKHCAKASSVIPLLRGLRDVSEYCTSLMRSSRHVRKSCSNSPSTASGFAQYKFGVQEERQKNTRLMPIQVPEPLWKILGQVDA